MRSSLRSRAHALLCVACFGAILVVSVLMTGPVGAGATGSELVAQPVFGIPAGRFLGTSPLEAPGEAWALARNAAKVLRYSDEGGWETQPGPFGPDEQPIAGLEFAPGTLAGRTTPVGGLAIAARTLSGAQMVIVHDPGGDFHTAPDPGELLQAEGESLFSEEGPNGVLLVPVEEPDGRTGVFDVPAAEPPSRQEAVLAFDGVEWARERICVGFELGSECTRPPSAFRVLAIDASGPENAWLLAKRAAPEEGLELFRREVGGGPEGEAVWRQRQLGPPDSLGSLFAQVAPEFPQPSPDPPLAVDVAARTGGQPLTVTSAGVWVDARLTAGGEGSDATVYYDIAEGQVTASWCDVADAAGLCRFELGAELPAGGGRSFAWPPDGESGDSFGQRAITGLGQGAVLDLEGTAFARLALAGGNAGAAEGAALDVTGEGWLGSSPPIHLTRAPEPNRLVAWPVPFRRPLTAVAPQPGASIADLESEALAVGVEGEVARYLPGRGWVPEPLLTGSGARAKPTLRALAWPEPGRAYAVGDGAMWLWRQDTGLWEPDPAESPNLVRANFTGIAFDPDDPSRGYAVGKQGLLLAYGRQWTQEPLPAGVDPEANFTSIAFAGDEALATYKMPVEKSGKAVYEGGVLVEDGSGWRVDTAAAEALAGDVPQRVAGLSDGGAAIASEEGRAGGGGTVIERQGPGEAWQEAPGTTGGYPASLAAIREGGQVRAVVTVSPGQGVEDLGTDFEQVFAQPPAGAPPLLTPPYPLPANGFLVRQTASGWRDEGHDSYPLPQRVEGQGLYDLPRRPDPMLALLIGPDGGQGWAVGGETGTSVRFQGSAIQTAGVLRYGPAATPPSNIAETPLESEAGAASFAIGGNAQCAGPCSDLAGTGIGPDVWLRAAVGRAAGVKGVRAFLYTGPSVASGGGSEGLADEVGRLAFRREEDAYGRRLGSAAGSLPAFAAPAVSDLDGKGSLSSFEDAFSGFGAPLGEGLPGAGIVPRSSLGQDGGYYSFDSTGAGGTVRVIVLDYSAPTLGEGQSCWLARELAGAGEEGTPAIVVGDRDLGGQAPNAAQDAVRVVPILVDGTPPSGCTLSGQPSGASAYFFDFPEQNRAYRLVSGARSIPAFGSGTLGYLVPQRPQETDFVGASGFLLASVDVAAREQATNVAPVSVRLIPNIAALALDATDGTVLRRSHVALFKALARRPLAGGECSGNFAPNTCEAVRPDPYVPIPAQCQGARCGSAVLPEYSFSSSRPDIADFVAVDPGSPNPRSILLQGENPVADSSSGLLCAFNAGTTTVTVTTGGLSYSEEVTVLGGSAQRPCGTTPLRNQPPPEPGVEPPPPVTGEPGFATGAVSLPPPPPPTAPAPSPSPPAVQTPPPLAIAPFVAPTVTTTPIVPIVPPPPAPVAQPTPPSGTSPVAVTEREEEAAFDLVHHSTQVSILLPALAVLAAVVAATAASDRRRRPGPRFAYQTTIARRFR